MSSTNLTFLELQNEALHDDFSPIRYRERVKGYINDWLGQVFSTTRIATADQDQAVSFTAGNKTASLPATSLRVVSLRNTTPSPDFELDEITQDQFDRLTDSTSEPTLYVLRAGGIDVWPTPGRDLQLQLRFRGDAAAMVDDDDVPAIPNKYRRMLVYHARSELFALGDDEEMAMFWAGKRDAAIRDLRADLQRRSGRRRRTRSMWADRVIPR